MKILKISLIIIAVVGVGHIICPAIPHSNAADILKKTQMATQHQNYKSVQVIKTAIPNSKPTTGTCIVQCKNGTRVLRAYESPQKQMLGSSNIKFDKHCVPLVEGEDTIAGRECWILRLKPQQKTMPWQQYWVDKNTYVVLAQRRWQDNKIIASFYAKNIEYK